MIDWILNGSDLILLLNLRSGCWFLCCLTFESTPNKKAILSLFIDRYDRVYRPGLARPLYSTFINFITPILPLCQVTYSHLCGNGLTLRQLHVAQLH